MGPLSYKNGTVEDYVGARGLKRLGKKKWSRHVARGVVFMNKVFHVDDVVLGGGNAKKLINLPEGCLIGSNANAFVVGFRMWEESSKQPFSRKKPTVNIVTGREQLAQPRAWRSA